MGRLRYCFGKSEKLTGEKRIEELFKTGSSFYFNDLMMKYKMAPEEETRHRVLISVPKKRFGRAVDRNLLKRRIREAYRLNKHLILPGNTSGCYYIGFVYLSKQILTFKQIQHQLIKCLERLERKR